MPFDLQLSANDWTALMPLIWLGGAAMLLLLLDAIRESPRISTGIATIGILLATRDLWEMSGIPALEDGAAMSALGGMLSITRGSLLLGLLCMAAAFYCGVLARGSLLTTEDGRHRTAFWSLLPISAAGMLMTLWANHFAILFLGIETFSIPLYVMAALRRAENASVEAGLKYFLLGAFAAGFLAFGGALLYAASGSLEATSAHLTTSPVSALAAVGAAALLIGLLFKGSVVPFHLWTPDVYEGAPTAITTFMASGTKAAAFGALLVWAPGAALLGGVGFALLATLTYAVGNFIALAQSDIKRLLAFSGIAHAGVLLFGFAARHAAMPSDAATGAIQFYLVVYGLAAIATFGALELLERFTESTSSQALRGAARRHPLLGSFLLVGILSLAGIPPTSGFLGKYYIFMSLVESGMVSWAIAFALLAVVSVAYYLRILVVLFLEEPAEEVRGRAKPDTIAAALLALPALAALWFGIAPTGLLSSLG